MGEYFGWVEIETKWNLEKKSMKIPRFTSGVEIETKWNLEYEKVCFMTYCDRALR